MENVARTIGVYWVYLEGGYMVNLPFGTPEKAPLPIGH